METRAVTLHEAGSVFCLKSRIPRLDRVTTGSGSDLVSAPEEYDVAECYTHLAPPEQRITTSSQLVLLRSTMFIA
jgi:hypothetical protein